MGVYYISTPFAIYPGVYYILTPLATYVGVFCSILAITLGGVLYTYLPPAIYLGLAAKSHDLPKLIIKFNALDVENHDT